MQTKETIHFLMTGGTIDSFYNGLKDSVETLKKSAIQSYIKSLKLYENTEFTTICMKDSRALSINDMTNLLEAIKKSPHKKFIVTHGTYTMPDSARFLEANLRKHNKTIIFTGSLIPLIGFAPSDASFNLGYAIAKIHDLKPGIKVCMNGKIFEPTEVAKLLYEGRFISVFNS